MTYVTVSKVLGKLSVLNRLRISLSLLLLTPLINQPLGSLANHLDPKKKSKKFKLTLLHIITNSWGILYLYLIQQQWLQNTASES